VDPQHDIEPYLEAAAQKNMRITHIIETHVQADHVSGARRLAEATGAPIFMHEAADVRFPHTDMADEDRLDLGNVGLRVLATPGHTPDGVSLLVTDRSRATEPWFILTGDTLFSGGVADRTCSAAARSAGSRSSCTTACTAGSCRSPTISRCFPRISAARRAARD